MAQIPQAPNVAAQRTAMKKLEFLAGEWSGEATVLRGPGQFAEMAQTESAQFKLDGLVLMIEGVGRAKADGKVSLQALGLISFDDETGTYKMRAFNDGRWLETEVKMAESGDSISWGFALGAFKTATVLRINENGEWIEHGEITIGERPPQPSTSGLPVIRGNPKLCFRNTESSSELFLNRGPATGLLRKQRIA